MTEVSSHASLQLAQNRRIEMAAIHLYSDMCGTLAGLSAFATAL